MPTYCNGSTAIKRKNEYNWHRRNCSSTKTMQGLTRAYSLLRNLMNRATNGSTIFSRIGLRWLLSLSELCYSSYLSYLTPAKVDTYELGEILHQAHFNVPQYIPESFFVKKYSIGNLYSTVKHKLQSRLWWRL